MVVLYLLCVKLGILLDLEWLAILGRFFQFFQSYRGWNIDGKWKYSQALKIITILHEETKSLIGISANFNKISPNHTQCG